MVLVLNFDGRIFFWLSFQLLDGIHADLLHLEVLVEGVVEEGERRVLLYQERQLRGALLDNLLERHQLVELEIQVAGQISEGQVERLVLDCDIHVNDNVVELDFGHVLNALDVVVLLCDLDDVDVVVVAKEKRQDDAIENESFYVEYFALRRNLRELQRLVVEVGLVALKNLQLVFAHVFVAKHDYQQVVHRVRRRDALNRQVFILLVLEIEEQLQLKLDFLLPLQLFILVFKQGDLQAVHLPVGAHKDQRTALIIIQHLADQIAVSSSLHLQPDAVGVRVLLG